MCDIMNANLYGSSMSKSTKQTQPAITRCNNLSIEIKELCRASSLHVLDHTACRRTAILETHTLGMVWFTVQGQTLGDLAKLLRTEHLEKQIGVLQGF